MTYLIHQKNFYYTGTLGVPSNGFLMDGRGSVVEFETKEDAQNRIDELGSSDYILSHGEYSRPEYTIRSGDSPMAGETDCVGDVYNTGDDVEGGTVVAAASLPKGVKNELDDESVEFLSVDADSVETWRAEISRAETDEDGDEIEVIYGINFYPTSTATQLHSDDLSNVDWDFPVYTRRDW